MFLQQQKNVVFGAVAVEHGLEVCFPSQTYRSGTYRFMSTQVELMTLKQRNTPWLPRYG